MRFAGIADVPGWALERQIEGLVEHGAVAGHYWSLYHCNPWDFEQEEIETYDAVRLGSASLLMWHLTQGRLPRRPKIILQLASFADFNSDQTNLLREAAAKVAAFAVVDPRLVAYCAQLRKPTFVFSDRCLPRYFYPVPEARPTAGPLRVGWCGSESFWPGVKNREWIERACVELGYEFVRQDRELDGQKDASEMRAWYNSLDIYAVANVELTPTPVPWIEAAGCGVQVVGTRCGELWPLLEAHLPAAVVREPTYEDLRDALARVGGLGREAIHMAGEDFRRRFSYYLYYNRSTAKQHTRDIASLCGAPAW